MSDATDDKWTRVECGELRALTTDILASMRVRKPDADQIADVLIWADLRGHGSHGVGRLPKYVEWMRRGDIDPDAVPIVVKNIGSLIQIDGRRAAGSVAASLGVREAIAAARTYGAAWAMIGETTHAGAIGYYMEAIAEAGMIAIGFAAGPPLMAYEGAAGATVSTAPIAIGLPTLTRPPFILDMATSVVSNGKIQQAARSKTAIPAGWGLDASGHSTTDPATLACLLPLGGAKGSGLALAFEAICSLSTSAPILQAALKAPIRNMQSLALCAIDIGQLRDLDGFRSEVDDLFDVIKSQKRREGVEEILIPGERAAKSAALSSKQGVRIETSVWSQLRRIASER